MDLEVYLQNIRFTELTTGQQLEEILCICIHFSTSKLKFEQFRIQNRAIRAIGL